MQRLVLSNTQTFKLLFIVVFSFCLVEVINIVTNRSLNSLGILPRTISGLTGVITAPWLHGGVGHFLSNIGPLIVLSFFVIQYGFKRYLGVSLLIIVGSGLTVWLFARTSHHIGASGLVYGYFGFLLVGGIISQKLKLILISVITAVAYGGLIWGVLPTQSYISFESHLFGFIFGVLAAFKFGKCRNNPYFYHF